MTIEFYDDFLNDAFGGNETWTADGDGVGAAAAAVTSGVFLSHGACGVVGLITGTTATGATILRQGVAAFPVGFGRLSGTWRIRHSSSLSDGVNDWGINIGFNNQNVAEAVPTVAVMLSYLPAVSANKWVAEVIMPTQGTVRVVTDEPIVGLTYRYLRIDIAEDGSSATFYIDDRKVAHIPITDPLNEQTLRYGPCARIFKTLGTSSRTLTIDEVRISKDSRRSA